MEARFGNGSHQFYGMGSNLNALGAKSLDWDLNDWRWDGDLFVASSLNATRSDCRNKQSLPVLAIGGVSNSPSSSSEGTESGINSKGQREPEKRRRIVALGGAESCEEVGSLTLKLGGNTHPAVEGDLTNWEGQSGNRIKVQGSNSSHPICQVEGCGADLSNAKDYHRRHKVCEMHAKAGRALVKHVMQRFCQQCSRFHLLQEFDEGKRSCRRRLDGHNKRRRKAPPDPSTSGNTVDDHTSSYLLISLLKILTNLHADSSNKTSNQDFLSHLLKSLAGSLDPTKLLQASQHLQKIGTSVATVSEAANDLGSNGVGAQESSRRPNSPSRVACIADHQEPSLRPLDQSASVAQAAFEMPARRNASGPSFEPAAGTVKLKDFDLNDTYDDSQDCVGEKIVTPLSLGTGSPNCPSWMQQDSHQSSPPQASGNSDSTSVQSLSNSNGDPQSRTDRIVFKLFGKDPNDFPVGLRAQIINWLSHSPTDMESYIRPGCIVLTIYLRLAESSWLELCRDLSSSLNRLLLLSGDDFWRTGWVFAMVQHHIAFICDGQVVLDGPSLLKTHNLGGISCVTPIAVTKSAKVNFKVNGFNLNRSTVRMLCAFEGQYLVQEPVEAIDDPDVGDELERSHGLSFSCSIPDAIGRGFIEVEDNGLSSGFFPFIVAETDVCSEIRTLESIIQIAAGDDHVKANSDAVNARNQAMSFLHEMGWLLRRSELRSRSEQVNTCINAFPVTQFRWLMAYAIDKEWCAVLRKLLDSLFQEKIYLGGRSPNELVYSENVLHIAVRKKCKMMVEFLLRYTPDTAYEERGSDRFLFRPDMVGPSNITPLHIAASSSDAESILDALTNDPRQVGIKAWKTARDMSGCTPEDYARSRGYDSYIQLVQKKISKKLEKSHLVLDIPGSMFVSDAAHKHSKGLDSCRPTSFECDMKKLRPMDQSYCKLCSNQFAVHRTARRSLLYRPAMLSMLAIAAVCVCVGLLWKSSPSVKCSDHPFRWELLSYGSI